jgi:nanoRNase/pAp phosphatase (c-di-AMP/oligoRNAs hydrolase)
MSNFDKFNNVFKDFDKNKKVAIFTHIVPDPDAIAAAVGLSWFLKKQYKIKSDIFYAGEISHPQNKTMTNVLSLVMKKAEEFEALEGDYSKNISVDCTEQHTGIKNIDLDIIFDHHRNLPNKKESEYDFVDIRQVGATSSIVYDLVSCTDCFQGDLSDSDKVVSTALLLGVYTDTKQLLSETTSDIDHKAYQELTKIADINKLNQIIHYPLPRYLYELEAEALRDENSEFIDDTRLSFVGFIPLKHRDALPVLSEKLMRMSGVTTSIVFAVVDNCIEASVRSEDVSLDVDDFVKKIFGKNAGGKYGAGAGKVEIDFFETGSQSEEVKDIICQAVKQTVISKIKREFSGEK